MHSQHLIWSKNAARGGKLNPDWQSLILVQYGLVRLTKACTLPMLVAAFLLSSGHCFSSSLPSREGQSVTQPGFGLAESQTKPLPLSSLGPEKPRPSPQPQGCAAVTSTPPQAGGRATSSPPIPTSTLATWGLQGQSSQVLCGGRASPHSALESLHLQAHAWSCECWLEVLCKESITPSWHFRVLHLQLLMQGCWHMLWNQGDVLPGRTWESWALVAVVGLPAARTPGSLLWKSPTPWQKPQLQKIRDPLRSAVW